MALRLGCVATAVALNLGAISVAVRSAPPPQAPRGMRLSLMDVTAPPRSHEKVGGTIDTVHADTPRATPRRRAAPARLDPVAPPPAVESESEVAAPLPEPPPPATLTHFYTFDEVEVPASPVADWELDAATLDGARIPRIVFDLFVSDEGSVIGCTIVEPADMNAELRSALEARLRSTALLPAIRSGQPVDSVRRIELFVS